MSGPPAAVVLGSSQPDQGKVALDDTIERWAPDLPEANRVTLLMLTNQTSGYPDYETDPKWLDAFNNDPFHVFTYEERLKYAFERPIERKNATRMTCASSFTVVSAPASVIALRARARMPLRRSGSKGEAAPITASAMPSSAARART